ncbi:MAG: 2TM domain-containing protein [Stellaceae bacterium]
MPHSIRGQKSEPIELRPGLGAARDAGRMAELERWAWRRVRTLRLFYSHLSLYVVVNFILFLIDSSTPGPAWFFAPLIGWGLIVVLHGLHAYELLPWTTHDWEQRKVRELIEGRLRR